MKQPEFVMVSLIFLNTREKGDEREVCIQTNEQT
jgi:hypothetical protein